MVTQQREHLLRIGKGLLRTRSQSRPRKSCTGKSRLCSDAFTQHIFNAHLLLVGCWGLKIEHPPFFSNV